MNVIPQEKHADTAVLTNSIESILELTTDFNHDNIRVFLFGSWASKQKSFTEGDVDIFVGVNDYNYAERTTPIATLTARTITVRTTDGDMYPNRRVELHWGDTADLIEETVEWERTELNIEL